jgi:formylglycine-generating enzyme required for sulfatase activity
MVILGDPGSGKSTFVNFLAHCLAMYNLEPEVNWLSHLPDWPAEENDCLPLVVILRDFARSLPKELPEGAEPHHLWDFIRKRLRAQNLEKAAEPVCQTLEAGGALVFLDGLDEVPTQAQRIFVRQAVRAFVERYPQNRYLVTCRVLSYQPPESPREPDLRLKELPEFELAPFDEEKIDQFIGCWYEELARLGTATADESPGMAQRLREAVRRPDLWRLASNPLLLTVMALVHTHKGLLPEARALLYEDTVDILLWRWDQVKAGGGVDALRLRQLLLEAGRSEVDLKRLLWELAYEAHMQAGESEDQNTLADFSELRLQKSLAALNENDHNWAIQVLEAVKVRAGLLLERAPEIFTFPHRTFQEYMAGAYLAAQPDFHIQASGLIAHSPLWRDVILLAVGRLVYLSGDTARPLALVGELCPVQIDEQIDLVWKKAWLAGDVLLEVGLQRVKDTALGRDLLDRVKKQLVALLRGGELTPVERARAGYTLGQLGDIRLEVTTVEGIQFCWVPKGVFWMGSDDNQDQDAESDEKPLHLVYLPDYWISRYPITIAQFQEFIQDGGYKQAKYWLEAKRTDEWRDGFIIKHFDPKPQRKPFIFGGSEKSPTEPVVHVSWYEALAFTQWLTERWQEAGYLQEGWKVHLPSEAEWEKAARGGEKIISQPTMKTVIMGIMYPNVEIATEVNPFPSRLYPWGNEFCPDNANTRQTSINAICVVGCFLEGFSPYGVMEMGGNVWEWTRSLWGADWESPSFKYPYRHFLIREKTEESSDVRRVLRGGAFIDGRLNIRCAARLRDYPERRSDYFGFRVVVSPS